MSFNEKSLFWICVILTMGMAFTALMISLPRTVDMNNPTRLDYQGTIVAIFALLVTVLIGWQIYSAMNIEKRVSLVERYLERAKSELKSEHERIGRIGDTTMDYSEANHCLIMSIVQYYEVLNRGSNLSDMEAAKHLCDCYIMSAKAMAMYLKIHEDSKSEDGYLISSANSCVQSLNLNAIQLFSKRYAEVVKDTFGVEEHKLCDDYYEDIMRYVGFVDKKNIDKLNTWRSKRTNLISKE